jgi:hypothetical protein
VQLHAKKIHMLTAQGNFSLVLWVGHKIILLYLGLLHFTFLKSLFYESLQFAILVCCFPWENNTFLWSVTPNPDAASQYLENH